MAASIKMRKFIPAANDELSASMLQCGRIYKDAEIPDDGARFFREHGELQCGRIYKDAEISECDLASCGAWVASMWPHL